MPRPFVTNYLSFTKKERRGILAITAAIAICVAVPFFGNLYQKKQKRNTTGYHTEMMALQLKQRDTVRHYAGRYDDDRYPHYREPAPRYNRRGELFYFDPNTIGTEGWKKLGLRDKTINTIQNYLAKGGHFYKAEDIRKIWGLFPDEADRLIPYITIKNEVRSTAPSASGFSTAAYTPRERPLININTADTSAFIALPGIGSKLAGRIVNFRNRLGGFYAVEQVAETFGLPDSTFQLVKSRLLADETGIRRLNINTLSTDELKQHPYIRYHLANAIVQYRNQHGPFLRKEDIKKIMLITEAQYAKLAPYITTEPGPPGE